jgi:ribosomal protein L12E/L44/L45/RPP1/RPP2
MGYNETPTEKDTAMKQFIENLKQQAIENPMQTLAAVAAITLAGAKLIDAAGHAQGSRAYAKDVNRRVKNSSK